MTDAFYAGRDGFDQFMGSAHVFIQWKGTDLCGDFHCTCGAHHHIDAEFVYEIQCSCGLIWEMPHTVAVKPIKKLVCGYVCKADI